MRRALALLFAFSWVSALPAGLRWDATEVDHEVPGGAGPLRIPFVFKVEGDRPVRILKVDSECGCMVAELDKRQYAPGETGRINATFTPGQRQGLLEKRILVHADDQAAPHELIFKVRIPYLVDSDVRLASWSPSEASVAKNIRITTAPGGTLVLKPLAAPQAARLRAELVSGGSPGESLLVLTPVEPVGTRTPALVPVTVYSIREGKPAKPMIFFARF
jgi:hypothetical protein